MSTLLIRNIQTLVSCDDGDAVYEGVDLYAEDGIIRAISANGDSDSRQIGASLPQAADRTIDASHMLCYPGLVNTHHHLYQVFSRNLSEVQNMELFDWLKTLYEIWKNLETDVVRLSSLVGMGELLKHGCTTCFDHHYVFPRGSGDLLGAQFAADELGMRFHASRGSMDLSVKDGGLPPDSVVQTVDEILRDSADAIARFHDPKPCAMHRVALAPCSPFSVSADLLRESAALARQYGVRLHTHLCETKDEEHYMLARDDIGQLAVGKCCDLFLVDARRLELVGALYDPKSVLATEGLRGAVDYTVVNGKIVVEHGRLVTVDEERVAAEANEKCRAYLRR